MTRILIFPGMVLEIPEDSVLPPTGDLTTYIIQRGDTLSEIAVMFGTTIAILLDLNPGIQNPSLIFPGQRLVVPASSVLPPTGEPSVQISQRSGPPGTQLTVMGGGFPANTTLRV